MNRVAQFVTLFVQFAVIHSASAAVTLKVSAPTLLPGGQLVSHELIAHPTAGENIGSIGVKGVTAVQGLGAHQVWAPFVDLPTPTQKSHDFYAAVWMPCWSQFDTYLYFTQSNAIVGDLVETRTGIGATLPPHPIYGPPHTGFGNMTPTAGGLYGSYYGAAGAGVDVPFMHLVKRVPDSLNLSLSFLTYRPYVTFNIVSTVVQPLYYPPIVTHNKLTAAPGTSVSDLFEALVAAPNTQSGWQNFAFSGPGIALQPSFDYGTHQFNWDSTGSAPGIYTATVRVTDGTGFTDSTLTITLVPEPTLLGLLIAPLFSASGLIRRR